MMNEQHFGKGVNHMNELTIYNNPDFGDIRAVEIGGEPWFVGKDVAVALGYSNPQKAVRDHVDDEDRTVNDSFTVNGTPVNLINESGLYSLALSSKLPTAKTFKRWVTSEVIPSIRKHGGYLLGQETMDNEELLSRALLFAQSKIEDRDRQIAELKPDAEYCKEVLRSEGLLSTAEIAKDLGFRSAQKLNQILSDLHVQYKVNGSWVLYREYAELGLAKSKIFLYGDKQYPKSNRHLYWKQSGYRFIYDLLKENGYLPTTV